MNPLVCRSALESFGEVISLNRRRTSPTMKSLVSDARVEAPLQPLLPLTAAALLPLPGMPNPCITARSSLRHPLFVLRDQHCLGRPAAYLGLRLRQDLPVLPESLASGHVSRAICTTVLLAEPQRRPMRFDWKRASIDASFAKAPEGGQDTGPNPMDWSKSGSKNDVNDRRPRRCRWRRRLWPPTSPRSPRSSRRSTTCRRRGASRGRSGRSLDRLQGDRAYDSEPVRQGFAAAGDHAGAGCPEDGARETALRGNSR